MGIQGFDIPNLEKGFTDQKNYHIKTTNEFLTNDDMLRPMVQPCTLSNQLNQFRFAESNNHLMSGDTTHKDL